MEEYLRETTMHSLEGGYGAWIILERHVAACLTLVQFVDQILGVLQLQGTANVY